jgi:hypothetical protein
VHNFVGVIRDISPAASLVETDLFPAGALHYYTKKNMGWEYSQEDYDTWQLPERGGEQGDYRNGMAEKIQNVISCLHHEPWNKRAVIPIPYSMHGSATIDWKNVGENKCCRELHFYMENGTFVLSSTSTYSIRLAIHSLQFYIPNDARQMARDKQPVKNVSLFSLSVSLFRSFILICYIL